MSDILPEVLHTFRAAHPAAVHSGDFMGYIVGLNRDRDSYQVPVAIAEGNQLDAFVTDYYDGVGPRIPSLAHRAHPAIPVDKVVASRGAFLRQLPYEARRRVGHAYFPTYGVERMLGRTIAKEAAARPESDLLLYSGSALQAFEGPSEGRRLLFQYHPSPDFIAQTMEGLDELGSLRPWRRQDEVSDPRMTRDHHREVAAADKAICASGFTARGLYEVGMNSADVSVVPYGCPAPTQAAAPVVQGGTRFLFCGQGTQRKGLHILMTAWNAANTGDAVLEIVSSAMGPEIEAMVGQGRRVTLRSGLTRRELDAAMLAADTFVLPSLLEGFGLVLGEALAQGCRIIATSNTGLVDMGLDDELATVIEPGKVEPLVRALEAHAGSADSVRPYHQKALEAARERSWAAFREGIRGSVVQ